VQHRRERESLESFWAKCTHGSVVRAIIDYALIAAGPSGSVRFGNAPLQSTDWDSVLRDCGASVLSDFYRKKGYCVAPCDLRMEVVELRRSGAIAKHVSLDPKALCEEVDLTDKSLLNEIETQEGNGFVGGKYRVCDYDCRKTQAYQRPGRHVYVINKQILRSNCIIHAPKLKTHEKVGITCCVKGLVGMVGSKDCLAHHRLGTPATGGDEFAANLPLLEVLSKIHDYCSTLPRESFLANGARRFERLVRRFLDRLGVVQAGAWEGNNTCWRMARDLLRIAYFAGDSGKLMPSLVRKHICLVDGIVAGEGQGPLRPEAVRAGLLIFGENLIEVDRLCARAMGFDPKKIPMLTVGPLAHLEYCEAPHSHVNFNGSIISLDDIDANCVRPFRPPQGWPVLSVPRRQSRSEQVLVEERCNPRKV
jgi:hypothetical protein